MAELLLNTIAKRLNNFRAVIKSQTEFKDELSDLDELIANIKAPLNIMVMGEFSTGKSTFINALLGQKVVKMDATPTTAVITKLCYGNKDEIIVYFKDNTSRVCSPAEFDALTASDGGMANEVHSRIKYVQRTLPIAYLKEATIIDSPGLEAEKTMRKEDEAITRQFMENADTILLMFDVNYMNKKTESDLLSNLSERLKPIGIVNKIDDYDEEEEDRSLEEYLDDYRRQMGDKISDLIGISAKMALDGQMTHDDNLIEESNIHALKETIATTVIPNREKYKLDSLLDRLGSLFFTFGSRLEQLDKDNKQTNNSDYEAYIEQRSKFISILDGLGEAAVPIYEYAKEHTVYSSCKMLLGIFYRYGIVAERNIDTALQYLEASAVKNNEIAQQALVSYFYNEEIYDKTFYWCSKLSLLGDPYAPYLLGTMYEYGLGTAINLDEAYKQYKSAGENNIAESYNKIAQFYQDGKGTSKDIEQSVEWYKKSAELGDKYAQYSLGLLYENEEGIKDWRQAVDYFEQAAEAELPEAQYKLSFYMKDDTDAFDLCRKAAEQGHAEAQNRLGLLYRKGEGVEKNSSKGVEWYKKSAENGCSWGQYNLAICYANGEGISKNEKSAFEWYLKAANQGLAEAQNRVGIYYYSGKGVEQNMNKAMKWFEISAGQGYNWAQYNLAKEYTSGNNIDKDDEKAFELYKKAAEQDIEDAQIALISCYKEGRGVAVNMGKVFLLWKELADKGNVRAKYETGLCYENGEGTPKDWRKAVSYFESAANANQPEAQYKLSLYLKDEKRAFDLCKKAAEQNIAEAQNRLGDLYIEGKGVEENLIEGANWFEKAAKQGLPLGELNIGLCYLEEFGRVKNDAEGIEWLSKAAEHGLARAQYILGSVYLWDYKKPFEAIKWLKKADEQGNLNAKMLMAFCYKGGIGVKKNFAEVYNIYLEVAKQGDPDGIAELGFCYQCGIGVEKNIIKARELYQKSAEKNSNRGEYYLAGLYAKEKDLDLNGNKAFYWYKRAAEHGHTSAYYELAICYADGIGIEADINKAFFWLKKVAENGNKDACFKVSSYYKYGLGTPVDKEKAHYWGKKAADNGKCWICKACGEPNTLTRERCEHCGADINGNKTNSSGCFITTAVCSSFAKADDCYELTQFRAFRDDWLMRQAGGVDLVHRYYEIAPRIVAQIDKRADAKAVYLDIWQRYLKQCLHYIEIGNNEQCRKLYMQMVRDLEDRYIN